MKKTRTIKTEKSREITSLPIESLATVRGGGGGGSRSGSAGGVIIIDRDGP